MRVFLEAESVTELPTQFMSSRNTFKNIQSDCPKILPYESHNWHFQEHSEYHIKLGIKRISIDKNWYVYTF